MNIPASKFSSGCESGWTIYLDQSYNNNISETEFHNDHDIGVVKVKEEDGYEEEEEDLSMVSDASSGPPHCHEDDREESSDLSAHSCWATNKSPKNLNNYNNIYKKKKRVVREKYHSCLDDTASSPISHKNKSSLSRKEALMEYSYGFSATHFKGESALDKHFGMFNSSLAKGSPSQKPGEFQGGNWK